MFDGLEQLKHLLQSRDHLFPQMSGYWNTDPKVDVYEQANQVKVVIQAAGLMSSENRHQWSMRVLDQNLYLRGRLEVEQSGRSDRGPYYRERRSEQFTKIIPLPSPVHRKPSAVQYKDGLLTILLEKQKGPVQEEWYTLDFLKKK